jgi:hypothetical protein
VPSRGLVASVKRYRLQLVGTARQIFKNSKQVLGDPSEGVPPVPIPNTEVKPFSPDGTARASVWESRTSPN